MTARPLFARAATAALALAGVLLGVAAPRAVYADTSAAVHCSLDRARALEHQGRVEAAASGTSLAHAVDHLRASSGEYALCAVQGSGGAARLALWKQAQSALRAAETPELQVGTPHDVDTLIAQVRAYDAAVSADSQIPLAARSAALAAFNGACRAAGARDDVQAREAACSAEYKSVVATRAYLALMPGFHAAVADAPAAAAAVPSPSADTMIAMPDGLRYVDTVVGTGAEARFGQHVSMQYTGTLPDGTVFDTSRGHGAFDFTIGTGTVIACWDEGVVGMHVGGHRTLVCPSNIAYGGNRQGVIPPYSTLHFDVELIAIQQ